MPALSDATRTIAVEALEFRRKYINATYLTFDKERHEKVKQIDAALANLREATVDTVDTQQGGEWMPVEAYENAHIALGYGENAPLPDDVRLCQRRPTQPTTQPVAGLAMPDDAREAIEVLIKLARKGIFTSREASDFYAQKAERVEAWLDAQRRPAGTG